jgi:hypothetical protein
MDWSKWVPNSWDPESRLWFYTTEQPLTEGQQDHVLNEGKRFFQEWAAHGQPLSATWIMPCPQLLVMAVFPGVEPTGCSLDKASTLIGCLEKELGLDFRNRKRLVMVREAGVLVAEPAFLIPYLDSGLGWLNQYAKTAKEFRDNPLLAMHTPWIKRMFGAHSLHQNT